jgi:carbamoyl-phosphate synthase large subunit
VEYFRSALGGAGEVIVCNSVALAPAMFAADRAIVVSPSYEKSYPDEVLNICRTLKVDLILSCHDLDTLVLARLKPALESMGVLAMLPESRWAEICLDKYLSSQILRKAGIPTPKSVVSLSDAKREILAGNFCFPLIVKARLGFGSMGLRLCNSLQELEMAYLQVQNEMESSIMERFMPLPRGSHVLVEEVLQGPEVRLDVVNDLEGRAIGHFVCEVHAMRAGETDMATVLPGDFLGDLPSKIATLTKHVGIWGFDLMYKDGTPHVIDVNPRFTGEYPVFHVAGVDVPRALVALRQGKQPDRQWLVPSVGVTMYKDMVPLAVPRRDAEGAANPRAGQV